MKRSEQKVEQAKRDVAWAEECLRMHHRQTGWLQQQVQDARERLVDTLREHAEQEPAPGGVPLSHDVTDPACKLHDPGALEAERMLCGLKYCLPVGTCRPCQGNRAEQEV